eukprot:jgi/Tetstr1/434762/TSEL_023813.t1
MYTEQGNVRNYLARHYFHVEGKDGQGGTKKGPLPSAERLAKALDLAKARQQQSELGRYYQAGKYPPSNVVFKVEKELIRRIVGVLKQHQKKAGGIITYNTNAVKNLAATLAFPNDIADKGSNPEPPAKKAKQSVKPAAVVVATGDQRINALRPSEDVHALWPGREVFHPQNGSRTLGGKAVAVEDVDGEEPLDLVVSFYGAYGDASGILWSAKFGQTWWDISWPAGAERDLNCQLVDSDSDLNIMNTEDRDNGRREFLRGVWYENSCR